jgi:hypothetical protein
MPPVGLAPRRLARAHAERRLNRGSARWEDDLIGRLRARQSVRRSVRHAPPRPEPGPAQLAKSAATPCNRQPAPPLSQPRLPRVGLARSRLIRRLPRAHVPELLSRAPAPGPLTYGGATSANRFLRVWIARFIGGRVRNCNRLGCPAATVVLRNGKCSMLHPSGPFEDWRSRRRLSGGGKTTLIRNGNLQVCRGLYRNPLARKPKFIPHFWTPVGP